MFTIEELELMLFAVRAAALSLANAKGMDNEWQANRVKRFEEVELQILAAIMDAEQSAALDKVELYKTGEHYD